MASKVAFDSELLEKAVLVGHHKTKKEAINSALKEYVMRHTQLNLVKFLEKLILPVIMTIKRLGKEHEFSYFV